MRDAGREDEGALRELDRPWIDVTYRLEGGWTDAPQATRFGIPPFLQAPGLPPTVPGLEDLAIDFSGGPVLALKPAEDGQRLILRLWNLLGRPAVGTVKLPRGFTRAEVCDALERPREDLSAKNRRAAFTVERRAIATIALCRK